VTESEQRTLEDAVRPVLLLRPHITSRQKQRIRLHVEPDKAKTFDSGNAHRWRKRRVARLRTSDGNEACKRSARNTALRYMNALSASCTHSVKCASMDPITRRVIPDAHESL
jgi:hypothetical protein